MAKTSAERAKEYRKRKRDGNESRSVTARHESVTEQGVTQERDAPHVAGPLPGNFGKPDCECQHCQQNRRQGNKHIINHGPYKRSHELVEHEVNRVSLPGDADHDGIGQLAHEVKA